MNTLKSTLTFVGALALLLAGVAAVPPARAQGGTPQVELSVLGGIQALNRNDAALPGGFINVPVAAAVAYHLAPTWAVEGEFSWMIPVEQSVDLGPAGAQDRRTRDLLTYQASLLAKLPLSGSAWTPYLAAGLGAVTFLANSDGDRLPQLIGSETTFAINFGAGTTFALAPHRALRAEFRELAAFPAKDAPGLSNGAEADPIWMERGTLGIAYRF